MKDAPTAPTSKVSTSGTKSSFLFLSLSCLLAFFLAFFKNRRSMKMCGTAVLRSQDCRRKPYPHSNKSDGSRSRRRKRSPTGVDSTNLPDRSNRHRKSPPAKNNTSNIINNNLVMGQVKILKRGDPLPDNRAGARIPTTPFKKLGVAGKSRDGGDDLILCSTGRLGPEPETVQKQIRASDFYAGSGPIVASPPPSSLPLPAFFSKKEKKIDEATSDLLRLLRLDLQ